MVEKSDGKTLYTQQLFWNARTGKIYSNVDSKIVQSGGRDVFIGEGFESDEEFKEWRFRRMKGRMEVEMKQGADSVASDSASEPPTPSAARVQPAQPARSAASGASTHPPPSERPAHPGSAARPEIPMYAIEASGEPAGSARPQSQN